MFIEYATKNLALEVVNMFKIYEDLISIETNSHDGMLLFDINIPSSIPFVFKYNTSKQPVILFQDDVIVMNKDSFYQICFM